VGKRSPGPGQLLAAGQKLVGGFVGEIRLAIAVPTHGDIKWRTVACFLASLDYLPYKLMFSFEAGPYVHLNREKLAQRAVDDKATHLFFLDTDMAFPPKSIQSLVNWDKDIIGASYNVKSFPPKSTIKFVNERGELIDKTFKPEEDPFKCAAVATGFMLIKIEALLKIPKPWFWYNLDQGGQMLDLGEDVYFCFKARRYGLEVWCDPSLKVKHLGEFAY